MSEGCVTQVVGGDNKDLHQASVGRQLKLAREAKGLSLLQVADALKLGKAQVEALEGDNWPALPGVTFIRGFVRNYGRLVGLDPARLMEMLEQKIHMERPELVLPESTHTDMPTPAGHVQPRDYLLAVIGLILVVLAVLIYFLLPNDIGSLRSGVTSLFNSISGAVTRSPSDPAQLPVEGQPVSSQPVLPPGSTVQQVISPQAIEVPAADLPISAPAQPVTAPPQMSGTQTPQAGTAELPATELPAALPKDRDSSAETAVAQAPLHLSFSKEAWVEVRDRRGNVIYAQNALPGSTRAIEGQPPFSLVIGNAQGVKVTYRAQVVDLTPHIRGDVARLTLE